MQKGAGHICILTKREKNKPLVWLSHTVFNSSQLQPCCSAGNGYSGVQTVHLFQHTNHRRDPSFFPPCLSFFHCTAVYVCVCAYIYVCLCVWMSVCLSDCMRLCQAWESIWMKNKTLVACLINVNMCNWL